MFFSSRRRHTRYWRDWSSDVCSSDLCWYLNRFAGENPFGWHALDIKTFAMALTGRDFLSTVKRNMPRGWFDDLPYTHKALDDAVSQGALFCNMLAEHRRRLKAGG